MENNERIQFGSTFKRKLIYVFRINDEAHKGYLKIGDATLESEKPNDQLIPNCHELNYAARKRIDSYTSTAGISYDLLYTELAVYKDKDTSKLKAFRDYKIHSVLSRSGIKRKFFDTNRKQNEWFKLDLETAKKAIECVKNNKTTLDENQITNDNNPIIFRPEQLDAINKTVSRFKTHEKMLWNAKMRFGKTLSALQVVKEMKFKKTIIITHRPVVDAGWFEDFGKIFYDSPEYQYGSKNNGHTFKDLIKNGCKFVYFASMQDLRGAEKVGGNFDKNNEIYKTDWDFVIVDEAHEGTQTELGQAVLDAIVKPDNDYKTYQLQLSGTPFNLLTNFESGDIFTWDYIMEQEAKQNWSLYHDGDSNPYDELPRMNIFTYHLEEHFKFLDLDDKAFNFREFFRTWTGDVKKDGKKIPSTVKAGDFVHEDDIKKFLKLICKKDNKTNYPFSTDEYRNYFRHSLWMVPGVKEAKALSKLLQADDSPFLGFKIINVAGDGDEEVANDEALTKVKKAITKNPEETYTITLSCGKLTTGVSVPEWTAVLMLAGSYSTKASQYLQTIFRVQTPANINGSIKEDAYVFDFAPDRTLKMVAEAVQLSSSSKGDSDEAKQLSAFLNYCPVISIEGSNMIEFSVNHLLQELKKAYVERVIRNGFDDTKIYNDELLKLDDIALEEFENLKKIIGQSKQTKSTGEIDINNQGFTDEEWETIQAAKKKPKKELTSEELEKLEELKKKKENAKTAMSILRGISIRMPLLVYGMDKDINIDITVDNFANDDLIDNQSWKEFMPEGVTKDIFKKFSKYYDKDVFVAASRRIRAISKTADELEPLERLQKIVQLFSTFKNPDKETVLTPWRVVNIHMAECLGGYCFYDERYENELEKPRKVDKGEITKNTLFNENANILEINSKTGLYPLYVTYSMYETRCKKLNETELTDQKKLDIWNSIVKNNIFVICKTPMAKSITRRTLIGYKNEKANLKYFEDLVNQLKEPGKTSNFIKKISKGKSYWKAEGKGDDMKFSAVVGNPPYQGESNNTRKPSIYPFFYDAAFKISDIVSLISPARFLFNVGDTSEEWNNKMLNDDHFKVVNYFPNSQDIFSTVEIKGGVAITLRDANKNFGKIGTFVNTKEMQDILNKVSKKNDESIMNYISSRGIYRFTDTFFVDYPDAPNKLGKGTGNMMASNVFSCVPEAFYVDKPKFNAVRILGLDGKIRSWKWIAKKYVQNNEYLDTFNVVLSKVNGSGVFGETLTPPLILNKGEGATDTFISIGQFENVSEAENMRKYIMSKFARAMLGVKKVTQDNPRHFWQYVPAQDFTDSSAIDWSKSIEEIDQQLYKKYDLNKEEINFIESNVKPMSNL